MSRIASRTSTRVVMALAATAAAGLLAACGSSAKKASPAAASAVPAVGHATDLHQAPVIGAGAGTPTQLAVKDLVVGSGAQATAASTVQIQYVGANYADGKTFDSSWSRGQPASFPLSGVIPGFAQGIVGMKVGGRREVVIPAALGYGAQGSPPAVAPNENLVFVIDLLAIQ